MIALHTWEPRLLKIRNVNFFHPQLTNFMRWVFGYRRVQRISDVQLEPFGYSSKAFTTRINSIEPGSVTLWLITVPPSSVHRAYYQRFISRHVYKAIVVHFSPSRNALYAVQPFGRAGVAYSKLRFTIAEDKGDCVTAEGRTPLTRTKSSAFICLWSTEPKLSFGRRVCD